MGLVAAVVGSQFGPAFVDKANGVVRLEVSCFYFLWLGALSRIDWLLRCPRKKSQMLANCVHHASVSVH